MSPSYTSIFLSLNNIFVLFPFLSFSTGFKLISWCFLVCTLVMAPLTIIIKDILFYQVPFIHKIVFDFSVMIMYMTNVYISVLALFKHQQFTSLFEIVLDNVIAGRNFLVHFLCFTTTQLINTVLILYAQMKRSNDLKYQLTTLFTDGFLTCRLMVAFFIMFTVINDIKARAMKLNSKLAHPHSWVYVRQLRVEHNSLCDHIQSVNKLFGVTLLMVIFYFITTFLRHAVFISKNSDDNFVAIVRCLWILTYGFHAVYLAQIGERIRNEAQETVSISYKQLLQNSHTKSQEVLRDYYLLGQQAFNRSFIITAAGFFNVDNSMLLFMATTFFTYFIVVMQLLSGRSKSFE